ncbi:MAG: cupin domain-containing protein [Solirubrobacteraceae bacterium]|nr:cupin domain-containing protein [Solirubrobacteraceae bacterium]
MANLHEPDYDEPRDHDGYRALRARVGRQIGTRRIGVSQWEIPPGEAAYPYHLHLTEEEVLVVLAGTPALRGPEGWRRLRDGEVVRFAPGPDGAHQLINDTDDPVRFLAISTHGEPDIVLYPDEGKLCAADRVPEGDIHRWFFRLEDEVDYWDGIDPPSAPSSI